MLHFPSLPDDIDFESDYISAEAVCDMSKLSRRQFLKAACVAGTSALVVGCTDMTTKLIPYVTAPEDIVPGEATWYATTCRECPAGCGLLAKNRDGHIIKVEGNPAHPVNTGKVCPRGQASVQGIYNPDRYPQPFTRNSRNKLTRASWKDAEQILVQKLIQLKQANKKGRIVFLTGLVTGSRKELIGRWSSALGGEHLMYEPIAYEVLRKANQVVFAKPLIPTYRIDQADFLLSFGANFLEYWISNVQFTRQFAQFHEPKPGGVKNIFVYVGPRLSMTAANADHWLGVPAGTESLVARALLGMAAKHARTGPGQEITPDLLQTHTGVSPERLRFIANELSKAKNPLILSEGATFQDPNAFQTAVAANMLQSNSPSRTTIDWGDPVSLSDVLYAAQMKELTDRMASGEIDVLAIDSANPIFHLPASWGFEKALQRVPLIVSFSSYPDETSSFAHIIMPTHTFLESWGNYSPRSSVNGVLQPVMGPMFATRSLEDILLSTGKQFSGNEAFPEKDAYDLVRKFWSKGGKGQAAADTDTLWEEYVQRGGVWTTSKDESSGAQAAAAGRGAAEFRFSALPEMPAEGSLKTFAFITYPTTQFFDGRMANRPFLEEMPDPMTMVPWEGWLEASPRTAELLGVKQGDMLTVQSSNGTLDGPVYIYPGLVDYAVAMPFGRGHSDSFGRYVADDKIGNPLRLISSQTDAAGGLVWSIAPVSLKKKGGFISLARADGSGYQHQRRLARDISLNEFRNSTGEKPDIVMPLPEGWREDVDFYPKHHHGDYRWGMAVDLDRCIGCQACVVACYAENNVGIVGKKNFLKGREMSWIHIERYFEQDQPLVRFLPVLCQHCDEAPCESVCPVFAPNHSEEGINNQVYNRCLGTRFCNQNCPWKVRRFNWFTFHHDKPLNWQLNPDVTVREKGVMEKCSFCIQRISDARTKAISEHRLIRDLEFQPACAQTCPADVLVFGNLKDPNSRVSQLIRQARTYQLLGGLNTKPAVFYLKKIIHQV